MNRRGNHDVDVGVAVIFARESDHRPVGREDWIGLRADAGRQAYGVPALAGHGPQIAGVTEDDLRAVDRRLLQERWVFGLGEADARQGEQRQGG